MPTGSLAASAACLVVLLPPLASAQTACPPSAPDGYHRHAGCTVTIDRDNPASPRPIVVRAGTTVTIRLVHARANEAITITPTTTGMAPVDAAAAFLKSAIAPLESFVIKEKRLHIQGGVSGTPDPIAAALDLLEDRLDDTAALIADASVQVSCLEGYRVLDGTAANYSCSVAPLDRGTFASARTKAVADMMAAARAPLPAATLKDVKKRIDEDVTASLALPATSEDRIAIRDHALARDDGYLSRYEVLDAAIKEAHKAQTRMLTTAEQLSVLANAPADVYYPIVRSTDYTASIAVVGQEVISRTSTAIAMVTVTWQANQWVVSTGIMFSSLVNSSFANGPLLVNGVPQFDAGGKVLTVVQQSDTRPTVVVPLASASYRIRSFSNRDWENRCPNHCGVLVTGGIGLNPSFKATEFAVGPSFQFGAVIVTPGWHIGRRTQLAQGVVIGAEFGSTPPNPLPTSRSWTAAFGLAVSYALPF